MVRPRPDGGPISLLREVVRRAVALARKGVRGVVARIHATLKTAVRSLRNPAIRESLLIAVAYVTGIAGLVISVVGNPTAPQSRSGAIGIGLMAVSFTCLFVVSVSILKATGGELGER